MHNKILFIVLVSAFLLPVVSSAGDSVYQQCQKACAGDGLSCVNKCLASQNAANGNAPVDTQVVVGDGEVADSERAADARERIANEGEAAVEREPVRERGFRRR